MSFTPHMLPPLGRWRVWQASLAVGIAALALVLMVSKAEAATLTSVSVTPGSLVAGATSNVTVQFTTAATTGSLPVGGKIVVTFPANFVVTNAAFVSFSTGGTGAIAVSTQVVTVTLSGNGALGAAAPGTLVLSGITNPTVAGATGTFTVTTQDAAGTQIDTLAGVAAVTIVAGPFVKMQLLVPGETAAAGSATGKTGTPSARTSDTQFSITVNAVDANWNVVTAAPTNTIAITSSDANFVAPTNQALASGTRAFNVTLPTVGTFTLTATNATDGTKTTSTSPSITVNVGAFAKMQLLVPGETAAAGSATGKTGTPSARTWNSQFAITVNAVDANWNVVTTAPTNTIAITSSDTNFVAPTNQALASGTRAFNVTLSTVGTFTLTATNATDGTKTTSTSPSITVNATAPGAPTIGSAAAGNSQATITFTAPGSTGGSAITSYTVTASPGGATGTGATSPITVTGLTNGTVYTFTVKATNAVGSGAASAISNAVTPTAPPSGGGGEEAPPPPPASSAAPVEPGLSQPVATTNVQTGTASETQTTTVSTTSSSGATAQVQVPPSALPAGATVRVAAIADLAALVRVAPLPQGATIAGGFQISARTTAGVAVTGNFDAPVSIVLTVPASALPAGAAADNVALAFWNGSQWAVTVATVSRNTNGSLSLSAAVDHFTLFVVLQQPPQPKPAGFSGGTIAASGVSLVSFTGTTAQLDAVGAFNTPRIVTVSATAGGKLFTFVIGAPAFANADFNAAFPAGLNATGVIVKTGV